MRRLSHRTFGTHLHAIYGDSELVIGLGPVRVIQGDVPPWVYAHALNWARQHENELRLAATPSAVSLQEAAAAAE